MYCFKLRLFLLILFSILSLQVEQVFSQNRLRAMFYNVENLFDCKHDSLKQDYEFLPSSMKAWHYARYKQKLNNIAKVITAVGEWEPPALVGLCEVENDTTIIDLIKHSSLNELGYRYVMTHSLDQRGVDVALLYQRGVFKLLASDSIRIYFPFKDCRPTRDILHVMGQIATGDSLDVFVCHMPSRMGGEQESEPNRLYAASLLRHCVDSVMTYRQNPKILIMGDFNDYPYNRSITQALGAKAPSLHLENKSLYNLLAQKERNLSLGSYKYQGEWNILDQLIVSGTLLDDKQNITTSCSKAKIFHPTFLLQRDDKFGDVKPYRTYNGMKYIGGYSDHLPVYVDLVWTSDK